jgi:hypothetical protein
MNTLLRRVSDHASHSYYNTARDFNRSSIDDRSKRFDLRDCVGQYALYYWVCSMHVIAMLLCSMHVIAMLLCSMHVAARMVAAAFTPEQATLVDQASEGKRIADLRAAISRTIAACRVVEAAALLLVASGFLLFFLPIIVMFYRIEQRIASLRREMQLRSDLGNVFLPFEFSPRLADGSESQTEMPILEARKHLGDLQPAALAQRMRFFACLVFVTTALICLTSFALVFVGIHLKSVNNECDKKCDPICQNAEDMMLIWILFTPELFPFVAPLCSALPLLLSLFLMTTREDRVMLMHPNRFLSSQLADSSNPFETERQTKLKAERIRIGIELM